MTRIESLCLFAVRLLVPVGLCSFVPCFHLRPAKMSPQLASNFSSVKVREEESQLIATARAHEDIANAKFVLQFCYVISSVYVVQ